MQKKRMDWDSYFLDIAKTVTNRVTCIKRNVGCVIVKDKSILSTGYNGAPSGHVHCEDLGECPRKIAGYGSGERLDLCVAAHAEGNAIAQAAKLGHSTNGATMYLTTSPCKECAKLIIGAGIKKVVYAESYPGHTDSVHLLRISGVKVVHWEKLK